MPTEFSVIVPAYNEAPTIEAAVHEIRSTFSELGCLYEIVIVDDGSTDETATIATALSATIPQIRLIRHEKNQGKGTAVKTGVLAASGIWVLFLDADLATHPSEFKKILPYLDTADIIMGSRRVLGARITKQQPFYRVWLGSAFNLFVRRYLGIQFHDTQCGFKAFHRRTLSLFNALNATGWAFDVELLLRAQEKGYMIQEVPVTWRHGRETRVRLADAWSIFRELLRMKR
ncbi:glycosyltransferase family 2 protein [Candidatus Uhrbacteria bacterium]|nr:glycosyltransferase family 2 protein [Candidatus Uhrbacteria bacterium]